MTRRTLIITLYHVTHMALKKTYTLIKISFILSVLVSAAERDGLSFNITVLVACMFSSLSWSGWHNVYVKSSYVYLCSVVHVPLPSQQFLVPLRLFPLSGQ